MARLRSALAGGSGDHDACGRSAAGGWNGGLASSVRLPPVTANTPTFPNGALIEVQEAAAGAQPGVDGAPATGAADLGAAQQGQRAVGSDPVAGVDPGAVFTVNRNWPSGSDLHPAWGGLLVRGTGCLWPG